MSEKALGVLSNDVLAQIQARVRFADIRQSAHASAASGYVVADPEEFAPPHLGFALLDAYDAIDGCPELWALHAWVETVRSRHNERPLPIDLDLTNGIALLRVMAIVAPAVFASMRERLNDSQNTGGRRLRDGNDARGGVADTSQGRTHYGNAETTLDEGGVTARRNIERLCRALGRFPWYDPATKQPLPSIDFAAVDSWALGGFVLLAAVTGPDASVYSREIDTFADEHRKVLNELIAKAVEALRNALPEADRLDLVRPKPKERGNLAVVVENALCTTQEIAPRHRRTDKIVDSVSSPFALRAVMPDGSDVASSHNHVAAHKDLEIPLSSMPELSQLGLGSEPALPRQGKQGAKRSSQKSGTAPARGRREPETVDEWRRYAAKLAADLESARQRTREWEEHAASLQRLALDLSDKLEAAQAEIAKQRVWRPSTPPSASPVTIAGHEKEPASQSHSPHASKLNRITRKESVTSPGVDKQLESVALRRRALDAEKNSAALSREVDRLRRELERVASGAATHGRSPNSSASLRRGLPR